jgi:transcriptional regulator with XRE-family HTH domain
MGKRKPEEPWIRQVFRTNMRNRRMELGITQRALAEMMGKSQPWVNFLESPVRREMPDLLTIALVAKCLSVAPHELLMPNRFKGEEAVDWTG